MMNDQSRKIANTFSQETLVRKSEQGLENLQQQVSRLSDTRAETLKERRIKEEKERRENQEKKAWVKDNLDKPGFSSVSGASPDLVRVAQYLGIDLHEFNQYEDKIMAIYEWGRLKAKGSHYLDVLEQVKSLNRFVDQSWGDNKITNLYRYVKLDLEEQRIKQERRLYRK